MTRLHHQPLAAFDWQKVAADVTENGAAVLRNLLPPASCESVAELYDEPRRIPLARPHGAAQFRQR